MPDEPRAAADIPNWRPDPRDKSPGWKVDPDDRKRNRYWDGGDWGDESLSAGELMRLKERAKQDSQPSEPQKIVVEQKKRGSGCATIVIILLVIGGIGALIDSCKGDESTSSSESKSSKTAVEPAPELKSKDKQNLARKATKILKRWGYWESASIVGVKQEGGNLVIGTKLWPKPSNERFATGMCTTLIGDDPPAVNVTGWIMVWGVTADAELKADECNTWHWDDVYGR